MLYGMENKIIWKRCPKCGQWCKAETGTMVNFAKGVYDCGVFGQKVGGSVGSVFGEKGKDVGKEIGQWVVGMSLGAANGIKEGLLNEKYVFDCKCGNFWSTDDPNDKQNAEFAAELAQEFSSLPYLQRKHLFICDELGLLPSSFKVLSKYYLPSDIVFPTGHPIENTLYVCHPYRQNSYLPYETYEIELLRDELREFKRIMKKLGAKHIDYSDLFKRDEEKKKSTRKLFKGGGENIKNEVQGSYEMDLTSEVEKGIQSEIKESWDGLLTKEMPELPDNLVWYNHREDWKDECESRLEGRTIQYSFTISVSSTEMTSEQEREQINAELKVLHSASVSGGYKSDKSLSLKKKSEMTWKVNVEFYPLSDYEKKEVPAIAPMVGNTQQKQESSLKTKLNVTWIMGAIILILLAVILCMLVL